MNDQFEIVQCPTRRCALRPAGLGLCAVSVLASVFVASAAWAQTITEFAIPTASSHPSEIAAGPDGNLWFTEEVANKIGRVTTAGVITEFAVPTANGEPQGITAGPDGALWFAEFRNKIGRITP